jgi:hypothetical protein
MASFRPSFEELEPRLMLAGDVWIGAASAMETASFMSLTVYRSEMMGTASVHYETSSGSGNGSATLGADYQAASGTLNFSMGEMSKTIQVPLLDDAVYEGNETFSVTLSNPVNMSLRQGQSTATGTIQDNEMPPTVGFDPASQTVQTGEAAGSAVFTVRLSGPSTQPVTVNYATSNGTAVAPGDYTAASGQLTFAAGQTQQTISVPIIDDNLYELTMENFSVAPTNIVGGTAGATSATGGTAWADYAPLCEHWERRPELMLSG